MESWSRWDALPACHGFRRSSYGWAEVTLTGAVNETDLRHAMVRVREYDDIYHGLDSSVWSACVPDKEQAYRKFLAEHERQVLDRR